MSISLTLSVGVVGQELGCVEAETSAVVPGLGENLSHGAGGYIGHLDTVRNRGVEVYM